MILNSNSMTAIGMADRGKGACMEKKNPLTIWKIVAIFSLIAAIVMTTLFCVTVTNVPKAGAQRAAATPINADLGYIRRPAVIMDRRE